MQTCLRHPESATARENRDTVFCQMRRAMDLIHYVVKDGVLNSEQLALSSSSGGAEEEWDNDRTTICSCIKHLEQLLELNKVTLEPSCNENLSAALDSVRFVLLFFYLIYTWNFLENQKHLTGNSFGDPHELLSWVRHPVYRDLPTIR